MERYEFKDAAEPYLAWIRGRISAVGGELVKLATHLAENRSRAREFFTETGGPADAKLAVRENFVIVEFPGSPVHLSVPFEPERMARSTKHDTVHITVDRPAPKEVGKPFRQYYTLPDLTPGVFDNLESRPTLASASSARSLGIDTSKLGMPQRRKKGGKTRRRMRRRKTVRSK